MALEDSDLSVLNESSSSSQIIKQKQSNGDDDAGGVQITCFTEIVQDTTTLHFQIIRLPKQIYAWIGCSSGKLGHLYAAAPTRPSAVSVTSIRGGTSDNTGSGISRRLVTRTGLNIILACSIPKNNPLIELDAEKLLVQKLLSLGYIRPKSQALVLADRTFQKPHFVGFSINSVAMPIINSDQDGILRSYSELRPSHFIKALRSFSLLTEDLLANTNVKLEFEEFEAGGYQWQ